MPKYCDTKEKAAKVVENLGESQIPCMIVVWTAADIQGSYLNEDDQQVLSEEQAAYVLQKMTSNFDASYGMNWDRVWDACAHYYPLCHGGCGKLECECECEKDE